MTGDPTSTFRTHADKSRNAASAAAAAPDLSHLTACTEEAWRAVRETDSGPADPTVFHVLRGRLEAARNTLPPLYRRAVYDPYTNALDEMGPVVFTATLAFDRDRKNAALVLLDIAQAILQNAEDYRDRATDSFQEVVSDLYDGFLSAEDRRGVKPPDLGVIPPLVKWGRPGNGPYTLPVPATLALGVRAPIVNLPPAHARRGLLAWSALGHETAGHDILHADVGLRAELSRRVRKALKDEGLGDHLSDYWGDRIDETASDVLGILNMGPAAAIGLIGYFRAIRGSSSGPGKLSNQGPETHVHPADILRGYLGAETVRLLRFDGAQGWGDALHAECAKDQRSKLGLAGHDVTPQNAKKSAEVVAETLVRSRVDALEHHSLGEIQNWRNSDETTQTQLVSILTGGTPMPSTIARGMYAAHAVAAAVIAAIAGRGEIPVIFDRLLTVLKAMHDLNPSWGPLFIAQRGDLAPHRAYDLHEEEE